MPSATLLARAASGTSAPIADATPAVATEPESDDEIETITYRVRKGDTLSSIARRYGMTVNGLKSLNNLRSSALRIGARLLVETDRAANSQQQQ